MSVSFRTSNGEGCRIRDSECCLDNSDGTPLDSDILTYCDGGVREPSQTEERNEIIVRMTCTLRPAGGRFHESSTHSSQATQHCQEVSRDLDHVQPRTLTNPDRRQTRVSSHLLLLCVQCITKDRLQVSGWIPTHLSGVGRRIVVVPPCLLI